MWGVDVCSVTGVSKHSGHTLPSVEVKDADVFIGAAGGHVLTWRIKLYLPGPKEFDGQHAVYRGGDAHVDCGGKCYPEQTAILTQGSLVEFLLFAAADVENPAKKERHLKNVGKKRLSCKINFPVANLTDLQIHVHVRTCSPDAAVLTANSSILAGGVYAHVVQCGLPHHVVGTLELCSSVSLPNKKKHVPALCSFSIR